MSIDIGDNGRMEFIYQFSDVDPRVSVRISPQATLDEAIQSFEGFLKAAGYIFDGELIIESKETANEDSAV